MTMRGEDCFAAIRAVNRIKDDGERRAAIARHWREAVRQLDQLRFTLRVLMGVGDPLREECADLSVPAYNVAWLLEQVRPALVNALPAQMRDAGNRNAAVTR